MRKARSCILQFTGCQSRAVSEPAFKGPQAQWLSDLVSSTSVQTRCYADSIAEQSQHTSAEGIATSRALSHVPSAITRQQQVPRILLKTPWSNQEHRDQRELLLQTCLDVLKSAGFNVALSMQDVYNQLKDHQSFKHHLVPEHSSKTPNDSRGQSEIPEHLLQVRQCLEFLRDKRLIYGRANPECKLPQGHKQYSYLYTALPYQNSFKGSPLVEKRRLEEMYANRMDRARRKVRSGKAPFAIHRTVASTSIFQQALAHEQAQKVAKTLLAP